MARFIVRRMAHCHTIHQVIDTRIGAMALRNGVVLFADEAVQLCQELCAWDVATNLPGHDKPAHWFDSNTDGYSTT